MEKERILLLAGNYYPEPTGIGKYNGEMVEWLSKQGHSCTVITTYPYYPHWAVQQPYLKTCSWYKSQTITVDGGVPINIIRCPHYIPKNPSGGRRLLSEFSFFLTALPVLFYLFFKKKFAYVITVAPPFEIGLLGILYKVIRGGKFIYHIQDLQIDAAQDFALIKSKIILQFFFFIERFILKNADWISTISAGMQQKVKLKCNREIILFPNWVNTRMFFPIQNKADIKIKFGFNALDKIILYSGAIGHKQGLEAILFAAKSLQSLPHLKFAICGSGPYKPNLIKLMEDLQLKNVVFLPLQPFSSFNAFLNMADLHLVIQKKFSGDLFLPSKLGPIFSVGGVAIVTALKDTSLFNMINIDNTGILIEPENAEELVNAIKNYDEQQLKTMGFNARLYAETRLSSHIIINDFFMKIFVDKNIPLILLKKMLKPI